MLKAGGADPAGSRIILLTDGQENVEPFVNTVQPTIIQEGITVDTILITANASNVLISLAAQTGRLFFEEYCGDVQHPDTNTYNILLISGTVHGCL